MNKIRLKFKKLWPERGSGMIEILIATAVVGLVMTAVAAGFVLSVKSTNVGKNRVLASTRAQEAMEVFRRERVLLGWAQFSSSVSNATYCVNDLPADSVAFQAMSTGVCADGAVITDTIFTREAVVDLFSGGGGGVDRIRVEIVIDWPENNTPVRLVQEFKQYE